jgi:hypothetical protein
LINEIAFVDEEPCIEVLLVLQAVMVILGEEETWEAAHKAMDKADFLKRLNQIFYIDITKAIKFSL